MQNTVAHKLFHDPRVAKAKALLRETLAEYQSQITAVKHSEGQSKRDYQKLLKEFGDNRGGQLFYPYLGSGIGNGALVELADGSVKYDFIIGIGVHFFGHGHLDVMESMVDAALSDVVMQGHLQQNVDSANFVQLLKDQAQKYKSKIEHVFLTSSGAMACENALKICFQKRFPANRVLAFEKCFMGRTLAVAQITDKAAYREGLPDTLKVDYIPFYDYCDHQGSIDRTIAAIHRHIKRYPCQHAVMCMELIQGEAGYWTGHPEFFQAIAKTLREHGISLMIDEVQTFGRTTELFAFQHFKLDEYVDVVSIGKNSQVCATLFTSDHKPRPGLISQTFTSSTSALAAGHTIVKSLINDGYLGEDGKTAKLHECFALRLAEIHKRHPKNLEGPYGIGAMVAMTLFNGDLARSKEFTLKLFTNGVLSFIAGTNPTRVRFLLPVGAVTEHDIEQVCIIIEKTLEEML